MSTTTSIKLKGYAKIVYISDDFENGSPPVVGLKYRITKELSTGRTPVYGAQLRRGDNRCGWVKIESYKDIMAHLDAGNEVEGLITSREVFEWYGDTCYWGMVEWHAIINLDIDSIKSEDAAT
ncbi:hypothetical protein DFP73DRAFT_598241 [Morchella snyderi]|nr:hypothetical protein DFP73DRAFT_598241 [Morchella snyderi]